MRSIKAMQIQSSGIEITLAGVKSIMVLIVKTPRPVKMQLSMAATQIFPEIRSFGEW